MQKFFKNRVLSLIVWIVILFVAIVTLPNISQLTSAHSNINLPANVQSEVAKTIQNDWGKKKKNTYELALVFNKQHGKLTYADKMAINDTVDKLQNNKKKYGITDVLAPDSNIATRKKLQSKDNTTWVMQLNISKKHGRVSDIENQIKNAIKTTGIRTYVTGADILQNAFSTSIQQGIKKTEALTVVFIFIVLIIVFRSPIVPLISLLTVGISFLTSFSIVTNLVQAANFPFSNFTQVFMVIVLFGIGTDYNILLYDKFKENLGKGMDKYKAMHNALWIAGKTILYSGSSILIGFTALILAKFSIYQSAVGVAVGVAVLLVVLLTLNPFFMAVLGKKMFWPAKRFEGEKEDKLWHGISSSTLKHSILYLIVLVVVVVPFMLMYTGHLNYDDTDEIADNVPAKKGLLVVQRHFSKGMAEPSFLYIKSKHRLDNEANLKLIDQLTKQLQASKDVSFVTSVTQPYGQAIKQLYVNNQLATVNSGVDEARSGLGKLSKGSKKAANGAQSLQTGAAQLESGTSGLQAGANQLQNGTSRLQAGASKLQTGAIRLENGAGRLSGGTHALQSGTSTLVTGAGKLQAGAGRLTTGSQNLKNGTQQLVNGLNQLSTQLSAQLTSSNTAQIAALQTALPQINQGIQSLNSQVSGINVDQYNSLLSSLADLEANVKQTQTQSVTAATTAYKQSLQAALASSGLSQTDQQKAAAASEKAFQAAMGSMSSSAAVPNINTNSLQASLNQISQLKSAVQQLASAANKALPGAAIALNKLNSGLTQVQSATQQSAASASRLNAGAASLANGANSLNTGLGSLVSGANRLNSGAAQLNSGISSLSAGLSGLDTGAGQLNNGLNQGASGAAQLSSGIGRLNSGAGKLTTGAGKLASNIPKITNGLNNTNSGLGQGEAYLQGLQSAAAAKTFYIPKEYLKDGMFQKSINVYLSPNKKSAMLIIVFNSNPSADKATQKAHELSTMAQKSLQGTALSHATVAMGGQSSKIEDTKSVASQDFLRTAVIMLIGIGIALIFVTRSLLQPIYILLTLLIAYVCSLSINQWIVKLVLGRTMLTWNTPFFSFIMLIALGVDYSIFLMTRFRELENEGNATPNARILKACGIIGTVVVSAAVILGGTFASLIPSGIPTLIEVALTVVVGLLILIFILPLTLTAGVNLTYGGIDLWNKHKENKKKL